MTACMVANKKRKQLLIVLISIIAIQSFSMSVALATSVSSSTDNWTTFHHDLNHSGYTSNGGSTDSFKPLWNYTTSASVLSSPAVVNGSVFVGGKDGYIYCFNASNGKIVWKFGPAGGEVDSSPAIYNNRVYICADDGFLYCLNVTSGYPFWIKWVGF